MNTSAYARYKKQYEKKFWERVTQKHDKDKKPQTPDQIYEQILEIIFLAGNDMERRVLSHKDRSEPELRDVLLASLNSHKDIFSSGESFNKIGKTDICQGRLRIPHFRRIKNPQISILEKGSRIVSNAENGGMAIDTRFVFTRLEHQ